MKLNQKNSSLKVFFILLLIILLGSFFRVYQLSQIPSAISWDEAAVGYNAWSIVNYGKDEWGKSFPLVFQSFLDDKHPVHIYMTAITVGILGLSEFSTRLSSAIFGILNILMIFLVGKKLFKSESAGLVSAAVLAISPYNIHFSRFNHEFNFAIFFFLLGLWLFLMSVDGKKKLLIWSVVSFSICFITYHSPKIVIPPMVLVLLLKHKNELLKMRKELLISGGILLLFLGLILFNPGLLGTARVKQTSIGQGQIEETSWFQATNNSLLGRSQIIGEQYLKHFDFQYLFVKGDQNPRLAAHNIGQFYLIDIFFLLAGIIFLLKDRSKVTLLMFTWILVAPLPSSFVNEAPQSARAMFMAPSLLLVIGYGIYRIFKLFERNDLKVILAIILFFAYGFLFKGFFMYYLDGYDKKNSIEWQYGMKQIVEYSGNHKEYPKIYMTDVRSQPYIFFLYYLKIPPDEFLKTVKYNTTNSRSYNLVYSFDRFQFGGWDVVESNPKESAMFVVEDSIYNGLRQKAFFGINQTIVLPDGARAFFMVAGY